MTERGKKLSQPAPGAAAAVICPGCGAEYARLPAYACPRCGASLCACGCERCRAACGLKRPGEKPRPDK